MIMNMRNRSLESPSIRAHNDPIPEAPKKKGFWAKLWGGIKGIGGALLGGVAQNMLGIGRGVMDNFSNKLTSGLISGT